MPYIKPVDKPFLDPHIQALRAVTVAAAKEKPDHIAVALAHLRLTGIQLVREAALDATEHFQGKRGTRYWILGINDGVLMQVGRELKRRKKLPAPSTSQVHEFEHLCRTLPAVPAPGIAGIDPLIRALVAEIRNIAERHNYDGAFAGLCNYTLTALGPRVLMDLFPRETHIAPGAKRRLKQALLQKLVYFWWDTAQVFYDTYAAPYEDQQIVANGDVVVYEEIDRWLEED